MSLVTTECRICRFPLEFLDGAEVLPCPACDALNARPKAEGLTLNVLRRANRQRLKCDFHNAEISYQQVLLEHPDEHEALWGLALCRYGVEHVEDPHTRRRLAVVHTTRRKPLQTDPDCVQACELAPEEVRAQYAAEAAYIDDVQREIRRIAETCPPYDVFLCHKTTVLGGTGYSEDYRRAKALHDHLTGLGLRVFFAPEVMESIAAGSDYEAAIYHALDTAKVMLLVCSSKAHLTSPWVQNEWQRFLEMADEDGGKHLIPLIYADMPIRELPRDIAVRKLQALRMGEPGAMEKLTESVCGYAGIQLNAPRQPVQPVQAPVQAPVQPVRQVPAPAQPAFVPAPAQETPSQSARRPRRTAPAAPVSAGQVVNYTAAESFTVDPVGEDGCRIRSFDGKETEVNVPPMIGMRRVVEIGPYAFRCREELKSVSLPVSVEKIGQYAFEDCTALTVATAPGLKEIHARAFAGCVKLREAPLPEGLRHIHRGAFEGCRALKEAILPDSVELLYPSAFAGCTGLTCAEMPEGLPTVAAMVFSGCTRLKEVVLPERLISIDYGAFYGCASLSSITLPQGLTIINYAAFEGCAALEQLVLPAHADIHGNPFRGCRRLALGVYGGSMGEAFALQYGIPYASVNAPMPPKPSHKLKPAALIAYTPEEHFKMSEFHENRLDRYEGRAAEVRIPPMIGGKAVKEIGTCCFKGGSYVLDELKRVVLPSGVESIGTTAFAYRAELEEVWMPHTVRRVGEEAFLNCGKVQFGTLQWLTDIGDRAFMNCQGLPEKLELSSLKTMGEEAFRGTNIRELTLPACLEKIRKSAFINCSELESVTIPEGVHTISDWSFRWCEKLEKLVLPERLHLIGIGAFHGCKRLKSVRLPEALESLGDKAFLDCSSLREVNVPEKTRVGKDAFRGCKLPLGQKLKLARRKEG